MATEAAEYQQRAVKRAADYEDHEKFGTKKFGRYKFEPADLDLNLSEDITGNLRTMKVQTLSNRFIITTCMFVV